MLDMVEALLEVLRSGQRAALATLTRAAEATPQRVGMRLLLREDGSTLGTIGGGAFEREVLQALQDVLTSGQPQLVTRGTGHMEALVEPVVGAPRLLVLGAGHVAKATAALARTVGFEVVVVDTRAELATPARFPGCRVELQDPVAFLRDTALSERDWILIVTHDHALDEAALELAAARPVRYIGMIGSRRKVGRVLEHLAAKGCTLDPRRVFAPVGLALGALGPEEIAVSIVAELIALRRDHKVPHMRVAE